MDWKKTAKRWLFPPMWLMILLAVVSGGLLAAVFLKDMNQSPLAYGVYVLSFYTLSVICLYCYTVLPGHYRALRRRIDQTPLGNRYLTDAAFRTHVSLYVSLGINLLYVAMNGLSYWMYRSMWFVILAGYYGILSVMRFLLLRYVRGNTIGTNRFGELKRAKLCSYILLTVNFVLSGAVLMILYQNKGFEYSGVLIYVAAAYTFYMTVHAIVDLVKYRKYNSPVMMITKIISLSAALVSMPTLETAMFSQFGGDMAPADQRLMIAFTGAGVSGIVIALSLYMIIRSSREIGLLPRKEEK